MQELVAHFKPDCAVIERVFVNVNPKSTLSLGQARGVAIAAMCLSATNAWALGLGRLAEAAAWAPGIRAGTGPVGSAPSPTAPLAAPPEGLVR